LSFAHGGATEGFEAYCVGFPRTGHGAVIMTNSSTGWDLILAILPVIAEEYDWPDVPLPD
jgi:hypothetical protein